MVASYKNPDNDPRGVEELLADNRVYFGKDGNSAPSYKRFLSEVKDGVVA